MKIPKLEKNPEKTRGIVYPDVTTWDVVLEYARLMKPYWMLVSLVVIGVALAVISTGIIAPTFYKKFFDTLSLVSNSPDHDISPLISIVFYILCLNLINWIGWRASWFCENYVVGHVRAEAVKKSFDYTIEHSYQFFTNTFAGALTQKINRFGRSFDIIFGSVFFDLFTLVLKIIGAGTVLYFARPALALIIGIWVLVFLCVSFFLSRIKMKYDIEAAAMDSRLGGALADSISNHASIQSFSGFKTESERVDAINTPFMNLNIFRWYFASTIDSVQALLSIGIEFFVFYYGIHYWQIGVISLGTFVLMQAYLISIGTSMWGFSRIVRNIHEGLADAKEMVKILHLRHGIEDIPNAKELLVKNGNIQFKDVGFTFAKPGEGGKAVFDGINISINPGEKVAFIGSSGAGKSTLVKLLLRLYDIQKGEILIDGQNIKEVTQKSLRENVSLVPQDPALFHRTLMENIRYGKRDATDAEVIQAAKLAHCDEFINEFPQKYETYVGERGVKLSGGERQRVAIARAILKNAPILVLDEATSSLDSHSESLIQDALHTLMEGKTTIVIAHRLSTIRKMDRIIVVSRGGVVEEGSHDELIKKPDGIYAKLWSLQAGGFANKSIEELLEV